MKTSLTLAFLALGHDGLSGHDGLHSAMRTCYAWEGVGRRAGRGGVGREGGEGEWERGIVILKVIGQMSCHSALLPSTFLLALQKWLL